MRWRGTLASISARAVRSTIRSWNEKRYSRRGPRVGLDEAGVDQPAHGVRRQLQDPLNVPHAVGRISTS